MRKTESDLGRLVETPWVCGGYSLELREEGYEVLFLSIHEGAPREDVFRAVLKELKGRAERSEDRKKVTLHLPDRDEAGLRTFLPIAKEEGFEVKLSPGYFGQTDGWRLAA